MTTHAGDRTAADVLDGLFEARYSCRQFLPDPVDRDTIERMFAIAQQGPSWCNTQPWGVVVTEGDGTARLREAAMRQATSAAPAPDVAFPERYEGDAQERRRTCARQLYESVGIEMGDREASGVQALKNFEFFGAPHVAIITTDNRLGPYGGVDCGVYLGGLLLAAQSLGLASIPQAALAAVAPAIRELFDVPEDRDVLCGMSFGYADHDAPANAFRTERAAVADVVT